ncbi:MAG: SecC motif-containing protein [Symploca sp. SIO2D2]|nr:SecC motif-containing protein [Symploca sp. SIO2D2]
METREEDSEFVPKVRDRSLCPCKSKRSYAECCGPYHKGKSKPKTAEQLMRSRYSAYFFRLVDYLVETTHPDTREKGLRKELQKTINQANWSFLIILQTSKGQASDKTGKVEFVAEYFVQGEPFELHETSRFKKHRGVWKYLDDRG